MRDLGDDGKLDTNVEGMMDVGMMTKGMRMLRDDSPPGM